MHDVLMITYNRPKMTFRALTRLLDSCDRRMRVWVWHNGRHQETLNVVESLRGHANFHHLEVSERNLKLREPTNWFWRVAGGSYLSKVDDDCLLPDGWGWQLRQLHDQVSTLGVIGCCRLRDEDFVPELVKAKLRRLHPSGCLVANCWVQGSGYVMKRKVVQELGPIRRHESFQDYCVRAALGGWQNGFPYPFIHEEHMDDPRSPYCEYQSEEEFRSRRPLSAITFDIRSLEEWKSRTKWLARSWQAAAYDPRQFVGWRQKWRRCVVRLRVAAGYREPWRVHERHSDSTRAPSKL